MKKLFICPKSVWEEEVPGLGLPRNAWLSGDSYVELPVLPSEAAHILVAGDFAKDYHEVNWSAHPEIARLTHPQNEADVPLADLHQHKRHAHKQFKQHHWDKLAALCALHGHQLTPAHTLWDLHEMLTPHYPGLKLARY
jgi:hypothetical protein